jgi:hypothetical protein
LLRNVLSIAVITRLASRSFNLTGSHCLGIEDVSDPTSPYYGRKPIPPLLDAQMDLMFRTIMQPLKKKLLSELKAKMLSRPDRRQYWYEIFLSVVILLNNLEYLYNRQMEQVHRYCEQVRVQPSLDRDAMSLHKSRAASDVLLSLPHMVNDGDMEVLSKCTVEPLQASLSRLGAIPE